MAQGSLRTTSPFAVISTPSNTGSPFETGEGGRAHHGGYQVDEEFRDRVTSPLLAALQDCRARGPLAEEEGGNLSGGGQPRRRAPVRGEAGRLAQVAFADSMDEYGTPQGVERPSYFTPDRSGRQDRRDEITYPLYRFPGREEAGICGGTIASRGGGPSKFCVDRNCGFAHTNKAWASLLPGGSYVQVSDKHALFDPMLPLEAAEHDSGSVGVLSESFTQEIWASVFRQLMDQWKDGTVGSRESVYVAATPGTKATPMRSAPKRGRIDDDSFGEAGEDPGEDITEILRCLRQIKGELGIRSETAAYHTVHGGLANSHNKWAQVDSDLGALPKQSDYDFVVHRSTMAETQSNTAIRELNELRLRGNSSGEMAGLKNHLEIAKEEITEMSGQMEMLVKIVQEMANASKNRET